MQIALQSVSFFLRSCQYKYLTAVLMKIMEYHLQHRLILHLLDPLSICDLCSFKNRHISRKQKIQFLQLFFHTVKLCRSHQGIHRNNIYCVKFFCLHIFRQIFIKLRRILIAVFNDKFSVSFRYFFHHCLKLFHRHGHPAARLDDLTDISSYDFLRFWRSKVLSELLCKRRIVRLRMRGRIFCVPFCQAFCQRQKSFRRNCKIKVSQQFFQIHLRQFGKLNLNLT